MKISFSQFTSRGAVRSINEDSVLAVSNDNYGLFVIADGMGGHFGGEIASGRLTEEMKKWWDSFCMEQREFEVCCDEIKDILKNVNDSIYSEYSKSGKICGTTVALILIYEDRYLLINVGDSRIYSLDKGKVRQLSADHVFSAEERLKGRLTDSEINEHHNKNKLTSAIGCTETFKMNVRTAPLDRCIFFLCSDGVYKYCDEKNIKAAMRESDPERSSDYICERVEEGGAGDNFSFIKICAGEVYGRSYVKMSAFIICAALMILLISVAGRNKNGEEDEYIMSESTAATVCQSEENSVTFRSETEVNDIESAEEVTELSEQHSEIYETQTDIDIYLPEDIVSIGFSK